MDNKSDSLSKSNLRQDLIDAATIIINKPAKDIKKFLRNSPEWKKLRESYMNEHKLCELCLTSGVETESKDVHHITPISEGGEPFLKSNLIALCRYCHQSTHSSGGICVELDLNNPNFLDDSPDVFTTYLDELNESVLTQCSEGDALNFIRERRPENVMYVALATKNNEYLGRIPHSVVLRHYVTTIDYGAESSAVIKKITTGRNPECTVEIFIGDYDYEEFEKFRVRDDEARDIIDRATELEKTDVEQAIFLYRKAIEKLKAIDQTYSQYPLSWRYTRFPINRLSLVSDRQKRYKECVEAIEDYEKFKDTLGLYKGEKEYLEKRKNKIIQKGLHLV